MPTKTKKRAVRREKSRTPIVAEKPLALRHSAEVHIHPRCVEFFEAGATTPYSRISNGAEGSEAYVSAQAAIGILKQTHDVTVRRFDARGVEIEAEQGALSL